MRTPRFPQEIVDQIIDHLHDDLAALAQCSLTNSAWLPSARLHRYREVNVTWESVKGFQDLLDAVPEIGSYVESLGVDFSSLYNRPRSYLRELSPILRSLVSKMSSIRELRLAHSPLPDPSILPTTITSVYVTKIWVDSPLDLQEWLAHLPRMRSLSYAGVCPPGPDFGFWNRGRGSGSDHLPLSTLHRPLGALEEFSLFAEGAEMDWLSNGLVPSRLRVLSLCPMYWRTKDEPMVRTVLGGVGSALHTLEISEAFCTVYSTHDPSLFFAQCEQLRTIRFVGWIMISGQQTMLSGFDWVSTFLGRLRAPNVDTIKFVPERKQSYHTTGLGWLEAILADVGRPGSSLHNLKRVVFELGNSNDKTDAALRRWKERFRQAVTRLHVALLNGPSSGLKCEIAFLGHGVDTWPVTHAHPITVATFFSGQETITWHSGYRPSGSKT